METDAEEILAAIEQKSGQADQDRISAILTSATESVPYYQCLKGSISRFEDLPVMDKVTIKQDLHSFIQDGLELEGLKSRSTSGSTGIPFTVYMDHDRYRRNQAGAVATLRYAGGDPFAPSLRARAWAKPSRKDRILNYLKEDYAYNGDHFDRSAILPVANWIQKRSGTVVQGYASYLEKIFQVFEDESFAFDSSAVGAVVAGAEAPTPYLFEAARRLFNLTAHARYSNMELGVMSISSKDANDVYKIDTSSFHVEILAEADDHPVVPGELGRIVVSDLRNKVMPLLRYDTGDLGRFGSDLQGQVHRNLLTDIQGRRLDILVGGTEEHPHRIHPLAVWGPVAAMGEIRQFQLRQRDIGHFKWTLNAARSSAVEEQLREVLDSRVGNIISCEFEYLTDVPVLASGKRQFFVNEIENPLGLVEEQGM